MKRPAVIASALLSLAGGGFGQTAEAPFFFDLHAAFAPDDIGTGGRVGFERVGPKAGLDFFFDLEARPYRRAVRIRESETLEYQYREDRVTFGPGVLARFGNSGETVRPVVGGGASLSIGSYRGSNRSAPTRLLPWGEVGLRFASPGSGFEWGVSYQWVPLPVVSGHRAAIFFGYRMKTGTR